MRMEDLVNGGRNYNDHKVAKFIASSFLACMNDVTIAPLSPLWAQWNWNLRADAEYVPQDEKTLWSFTVHLHWQGRLHV